MSLCRTPVNQNIKRKLESDFTEAHDQDEIANSSKKLNSSINKSDLENQKSQINKFSINFIDTNFVFLFLF